MPLKRLAQVVASRPYKYRFFGTPPSGANGERKSGDTPETPPGALPLDPASKKPILERRGGVPRLFSPSRRRRRHKELALGVHDGIKEDTMSKEQVGTYTITILPGD